MSLTPAAAPNNHAHLLDDRGAGKVAEGLVGVEVATQRLPQAALVGLGGGEGEGRGGCRVLGGLLVPLLAHHHILHARIAPPRRRVRALPVCVVGKCGV